MTKRILKSFQYLLFPFLFHVLFISSVSAQTVTSYSPTKGSTPASLAPGSTAGSYALSGFDTLNPYNLSLNFRLPLLPVGGRGKSGYTMMLPIQRKWRVNKTVTDSRIGCQACEEHIVTYSIQANSDWWHPEIGEFGPGMMAARYSGFNLIQGCFSDSRHWQKALTRLTFTAADGTEYEFRDQNSGGAPLDVPSCNQGASRGRVFVTADGSAATFISDSPIVDSVVPVAADSYFLVSGYLLLRDGTRYRIDEGKVTWIRDRNGNQTRFEPGKIIDSLNREITFSYEYNAIGILLAKQIGFKGFNGASRTIRIVYDDLENAFRPANAEHAAETTKTFGQLFPGITDWGESGNNAGDEFFTRVISRVILPDGRSYRFYYNSYAELARVELPTGGAFEYDWTGDVVNMGGSFDLGPNYEIYRQLVERRVYNVTTLEGRTILGACPNLPGPGLICRQVDQVDPNNSNSLLARTRHFYFGSSGPTGLFKEEIHYSKWNEGKEFKTEAFAKDGTTVLQRTETNWVQRTNVTWWAPNSTLFGPEPANDPRVTFINSTLPDLNKVSRQEFFYDDSLPFNNRADVYEYDFGPGSPGTLLRRTHTSYVTAANYVGTDGLAVYAGTAAHIRSLPSERWVSSDANGTAKRSITSFEYDNYTIDSPHALLTPRTDITGLCTTFDNAGLCANVAPENYVTRGNPTSVTSYLQPASPPSGPVTVAMQYDVAGNIIKFLDSRSIASQLYYATTIDYTDRFGGPDGEARANAGAAELNVNPLKRTYAFATLITNPLGHTTYSQFDYYLGQPVNAEDENGVIVSGRYDDALDRPTQVKRAISITGLETQTTFAYDDAARTITTSSDRDGLNDNVLIGKLLYDPLGRTAEVRQYEGGGTFIATKTEYDALGRAFKTSNPYRPQSESAEWTISAFDGLGRVISVTKPGGAVANTSYSGNTVTITDQADKRRKSVSDALGRLIELVEDPDVPGGPTELNFHTTYLYDALDNLVQVTQGGQQRFFMYDSLRRLIRSRSPEQATLPSLNLSDPITGNSAWSIAYQYDASSNLTQKTDARGVVSTYVYDALNRNTSVDYSDSTPDVFRQYDLAVKGIGRINQVWQGGSTTSATYIDSYDALGRPLVQRQRYETAGVWSSSYQTTRTYNLAGSVTSQVYPSGNSVTYTYDAAGRTSNFSGNLGDGGMRTYANNITYSPFGGTSREQFGTNTPLYQKSFYNIRGQLFDTRLSSVNDLWDWNRGRLILYYSSNHVWGGSGTDNNGNVLFAQTWIPPENATLDQADTLSEQSYEYDSLSRLKSVTEERISVSSGWVWQPQFKQSYDYDRYGNRTIKTGTTDTWGTGINNRSFEIEATTNRLYSPGDLALADTSRRIRYDAAGNQFKDTYTGYGNATFDAENRIITIQDNLGGSSTYTYNADGQRTRRKINNQETWQVYGFEGELLAEYPANGPATSPHKEYGYRNGELLISASRPNCGVGYQGTKSWAATNPALGHIVGHQEGSDWVTTVSGDAAGHLSYGPYDNTFGQGHHNAKFLLQVDNTSGSDVVASVDVVTALGTTILAQRQIRRNEFSAANQWQWFTLEFDNPCFGLVEARVYWHDTVNMRLNQVTITGLDSAAANVQWLVTDHLGTPRMIVAQTGALANIKRHDYLPFGEELFAPAGGRKPEWGYSSGDSVRHQFTSKERDIETGLDYFLARYYSNTQGRFTSADPFSIILLRQNSKNEANRQAFNEFIGDPRRWNRFAYAVNSPLVFTDKTGLDIMVIENHSTKGNPIGHTAIAITGHGVYSMGNAERTDRSDRRVGNNIVGGGVREYLDREAGRRSTTLIIIKTTPEQDAAALKKLRDSAHDPRQLTSGDIASDNCSVRSNAALDAAGITTPMEPPIAVMPGSAGWRAMAQDGAQVIEIQQGTPVSYLKDGDKKLIQQFEPTDSNDVDRQMMPPATPRQPRRRDDIKP